MTDDTARRWPPLSVWVAAGLLALPPTTWLMLAVAYDRRPDVLAVPLVWLLLTVGPVWGLLRGRPRGFGGAVGLLLLVAIALGCGTAYVIAASGGWATVAGAFPAVVWLGTVAALLWWRATRVWCGRLPADPYGEFDD